jgi:acyl-CoA synthetase (AMP-forming)/AMP-acid ligase II
VSEPSTLAEILLRRAATQGERIAYTFLADGAENAQSITWAQLHRRAAAMACTLMQHRVGAQPVMLALPPGLSFIESLFGCWYAGVIAVPVSLPRHQRVKHRLDRIVQNAGARFAIGSSQTRDRLTAGEGEGALCGQMTWIAPPPGSNPASDTDPTLALPESTAPAVLQYTSGSTGSPRGVIVTHANLMANSALIAQACDHTDASTIGGWLPLFHDMGLVGLVLQAAFTGARCVLMPPERFLMRPWLWLKMICDHRIQSSPAPNFGYDLCVDRVTAQHAAGLDLSCWHNALNGSEPVRASTLQRFASAFAGCGFDARAFFPCYGLAEATLLVTGPGPMRFRRWSRRTAAGLPLFDNSTGGHVACGHTFGDTNIEIVDHHTRRPATPGTVGEIWVRGPSCAQGYWRDAPATAATFAARLDADESASTASASAARWLRTGDLGFIAGGELFITGRLRDLIIIAGRNHFPVDLEQTAESADPSLAPGGVAAFSVDDAGVERLVIVAEIRRPADRSLASPLNAQSICQRIRAAVAAEHEITPADLVLLRPGGVPRTTSGKISRAASRDAYLGGTLDRLQEEPAHASHQ